MYGDGYSHPTDCVWPWRAQKPTSTDECFVRHWLTQIIEVQCAHSALRLHGCTGEVYVLLRKSAEKKAENRERHQKLLG